MSGGRLEISLKPSVLRWARERVGLAPEALAKKIGVKPERVRDWEGSGRISISQADRLAHHTRTPLGYLYLPEPVEDRLPIPDFRTLTDQAPPSPSPELLDSIQLMQRRQAWFRDELIESGQEPLGFVGSLGLSTPVEQAADTVRDTLRLERTWASRQPTWTEALRHLRDRIEAAGILVVFNGVVGNNTHRTLDPAEFRGFVLVDEHAPLLFVNGADYKSPQMFTLAHELAHIWIGQGGVSNFDLVRPPSHEVERFCNLVAAEILVPERELRAAWKTIAASAEPYEAVARRFKVSTLVAARRALDLELIGRRAFFKFYEEWEQDERRKQNVQSEGGSFWNNQNVRIGRRFGAAVVRAVSEGRLLYREAYGLTGLKGKTFDEFARQVGAEL